MYLIDLFDDALCTVFSYDDLLCPKVTAISLRQHIKLRLIDFKKGYRAFKRKLWQALFQVNNSR